MIRRRFHIFKWQCEKPEQLVAVLVEVFQVFDHHDLIVYEQFFVFCYLPNKLELVEVFFKRNPNRFSYVNIIHSVMFFLKIMDFI